MFKQRLLYKSKAKAKLPICINEAYTTQTCSKCGVKNQIGDSKVYKCKCGLECDRDINSAKNICIKALLSIEDRRWILKKN